LVIFLVQPASRTQLYLATAWFPRILRRIASGAMVRTVLSSAKENLMPRTLPRLGAIAATIAVLGLTAGCARTRDHKGYVVDSTLISTVQPGVDNRDSVARTLGRPSFAGQFDKDQTWYYVARDTRQLAFANPRATAQIVLEVHFDPKGNVVSVNRTGVEKVASIRLYGERTPTLGRDRGFFQELFGNIGRVGSVSGAGGTADNPTGGGGQ
jgi:outer membrane protein assembly factor BamE (lipoprotein component of BamABCDE complex)